VHKTLLVIGTQPFKWPRFDSDYL